MRYLKVIDALKEKLTAENVDHDFFPMGLLPAKQEGMRIGMQLISTTKSYGTKDYNNRQLVQLTIYARGNKLVDNTELDRVASIIWDRLCTLEYTSDWVHPEGFQMTNAFAGMVNIYTVSFVHKYKEPVPAVETLEGVDINEV